MKALKKYPSYLIAILFSVIITLYFSKIYYGEVVYLVPMEPVTPVQQNVLKSNLLESNSKNWIVYFYSFDCKYCESIKSKIVDANFVANYFDIKETPTFIINDYKIKGAIKEEAFKAILEGKYNN